MGGTRRAGKIQNDSMMASCILTCLRPGLLTTVQDQGRYGYGHLGVPRGGCLDRLSAKIANALVGNHLREAVLEITMLGPTFFVEGECQMAIAGAEIPVLLNKEPIPMYRTVTVPHQSTLKFGNTKTGCRSYLAIRGRWKVRPWLESASAALYEPRATPDSIMAKGAHLKVETDAQIQVKALIDKQFMHGRLASFEVSAALSARQPDRGVFVHVIPGPEFNQLSSSDIAVFFGNWHRIHPQSNRMGYRLGTLLPKYQPSESMISSGCTPGTIQLSRDGRPMILMADAQTTGGYPRIGKVVESDLDILAQARPGDYLSFKYLDPEVAQDHHLKYLAQVNKLLEIIN